MDFKFPIFTQIFEHKTYFIIWIIKRNGFINKNK